jgi:uncharacterized protein YcbK (DUF882 family)
LPAGGGAEVHSTAERWSMNRRRFLLGAAGLVSAPSAAFATPVLSAPRRLRLVDAHTGTIFDGAYRDADGPIGRVMDELCVFLCDHHSGEMINIDVGVIDFLADVMAAIGQTRAVVLSAYRSRETNAMLARTTFGVAENSQHLYGRALDVRFDARLPDAMAAAREMKRGGVGWYPHSGFIHLDTGPVRNWDLDTGGLQEMLITPRPTPVSSAPKGEMLVSGPGRLIIGGGKPTIVLPGRASLHGRQRVAGLFRPLAKP